MTNELEEDATETLPEKAMRRGDKANHYTNQAEDYERSADKGPTDNGKGYKNLAHKESCR
jgi:hypothetical protein